MEKGQDYLPFELLVGERIPQGYRVTVVESPAGDASGLCTLEPQDVALQHTLSVLMGGQDEQGLLVELGDYLFDSLFGGPVGSALRESLSIARSTGKRLRVRLRVEDAGLAALPWEYLHDPVEDCFLAISPNTPLLRYVPLRIPPRPLEVRPPLRILVVIASPKDMPLLDVKREMAIIQEALDGPLSAGKVQLQVVEHANLAAVTQALRSFQPHVFHFIGHGIFQDGQGYAALENEAGQTHLLDESTFRELFLGAEETRLAVLNACQSAALSPASPLAGLAPKLLQRRLGGVVAMQQAVSDQAALVFTREFYRSLALGAPVDVAVAEGRKGIYLEIGKDSRDWGMPVLYLRSKDGCLFNLASKAETVQAPSDEQKNLRILMQSVHTQWVRDVLEVELSQATELDLRMERRPDLLSRRGGRVLVSPDRPSEMLPPEAEIEQVFDEAGRALLIVGAPGSGKTITLLELARALIERAQSDPSQPVPVVLRLATWGQRQLPLAEWIISELNAQYDAPRGMGEDWLKNNKLVLLLDGLDDVTEEYQTACAQAINQFRAGYGLTGIAVCSRLEEYERLESWLRLGWAVLVQPLTPAQVDQYLTAGGERLAGLRQLLQQDAELQEMANSPLWLSVMGDVYQDLPPGALAGQNPPGQTRHQQLLDAYIQHRFATCADERPYSPDQTRHWLGWLARKMKQQETGRLRLEHLQPAWLESRVQRLIYLLLIGLAVWLPILLLIRWVLQESVPFFYSRIGSQGQAYYLNVVAPVVGLACALTVWLAVNRRYSIRSGLLVGGAFAVGMSLAYRPAIRSAWLAGLLGLATGGAIGLVVIVYSLKHKSEAALALGEVRTVEIKRMSRKDIILGLLVGLGLGLVMALAFDFIEVLNAGRDPLVFSLGRYKYSQEMWEKFGFAAVFAFSLLFGLAFGLLRGEVDLESEKSQPNLGIRRSGRTGLGVGALAVLCFLPLTFSGGYFMLHGDFDELLGGGLLSGLLGIAIASYVGTWLMLYSRLSKREAGLALDNTSSVEVNRLNRKDILLGLLVGLGSGLVAALIFNYSIALYLGLDPLAVFLGRSEYSQLIWSKLGFTFFMTCGLFGGLVFGLLRGETRIERKDQPSQRMQYARAMGLWIGAFLVLCFAIFLAFGKGHVGISFGLLAGVGMGLYFGGYAFIQHYVLRLLLWCSGKIPWNYEHFLNYAADLILLHRSGGGYIFKHGLLMDHFAAMDEPSDVEHNRSGELFA